MSLSVYMHLLKGNPYAGSDILLYQMSSSSTNQFSASNDVDSLQKWS